MAETTFFILGGVLVGLALLLSAVGLRWERFPGSRGLAVTIPILIAALVVATGAFAWIQAEDHQDEYAAELAAERAEAADERAAQLSEQLAAAEGTSPDAGDDGGQPPEEGGGAGPADTTLELTSPEDGSLSFDTETLEADAGTIAIDYTNPSPVPHDVAIEADGATVAQGEVVTDGGTSTAEADLESGAYAFFCSVPGHREAGMEGELTVR